MVSAFVHQASYQHSNPSIAKVEMFLFLMINKQWSTFWSGECERADQVEIMEQQDLDLFLLRIIDFHANKN